MKKNTATLVADINLAEICDPRDYQAIQSDYQDGLLLVEYDKNDNYQDIPEFQAHYGRDDWDR